MLYFENIVLDVPINATKNNKNLYIKYVFSTETWYINIATGNINKIHRKYIVVCKRIFVFLKANQTQRNWNNTNKKPNILTEHSIGKRPLSGYCWNQKISFAQNFIRQINSELTNYLHGLHHNTSIGASASTHTLGEQH